jgi:hypothetical protein
MYQQDHAPLPHQAPVKKKSSKLLGCGLIALVVGLVLIGILVAAASGGSDSPSPSTDSRSCSSAPKLPTTKKVKGKKRGTIRVAKPALCTETSGTDSDAPAAQPQTYKGRGSKVVRIKDGGRAWLVSLAHKGKSNFTVEIIDAKGKEVDLLVNTIGKYKGTVAFNLVDGYLTDRAKIAAVKINADGPWAMKLQPPTAAPAWSGPVAKGVGDRVLRLPAKSSGLTTVKAAHTGTSNFVVESFTDDGSDLAINEIGKYKGEVQMPDDTIYVTVEADGAWKLTKS